MQGCNLLESGTDLKASFFFFLSLLCLKFSKYATAECELSFVVLVITSQAKLRALSYLTPSSPLTSWQRQDHAKVSLHEIQMLDMSNRFHISSKMPLYAIMRNSKVFPPAVRLCLYSLPACQSND